MGGLENNFSQRTTVRTHDPEQNQDLNLLKGSKSVNNPEQPRFNNRSNDMKKVFLSLITERILTRMMIQYHLVIHDLE